MKLAPLLLFILFVNRFSVVAQNASEIKCINGDLPIHHYHFTDPDITITAAFSFAGSVSGGSGYVEFEPRMGFPFFIINDRRYTPFDRFNPGKMLDTSDVHRVMSNRLPILIDRTYKEHEVFDINEHLRSLTIHSARICEFATSGNTGVTDAPDLTFDDCTSETLHFTASVFNKLRFLGGSATWMEFTKCSFGELSLQNNALETRFYQCTFKAPPAIRIDSSLRQLSFIDCNLSQMSGVIDLTKFARDKVAGQCRLRIEKTDIARFRFNYGDFVLDTEEMSFEDVQTMYKQLKDIYLSQGMTRNFELVDIDLQKLESAYRPSSYYRFASWLSEKWWNYGYDKSLIIINSMVLFCLFFLINLMIGLEHLLKLGYSLQQQDLVLDKIERSRYWITRAIKKWMYTLLFTFYVFWGINLDKKNLHFQNLRYMCYLLVQYLVGLVCLAYLANYILSK